MPGSWSGSRSRRGRLRARVTGVTLVAVALSPVLTSCGQDRPPKPRCQAGYYAEWDNDDHEWECERSGSHSRSDHKDSRRQNRK